MTAGLYICIDGLRKALTFQERSKNSNLKELGRNDKKNLFIEYNLGQNIWNRVNKSSKTGQKQKTLIIASGKFLTVVTKVLFLEGRLGTRLYLYPI